MNRVLRPGGILILGTPDYGRWLWWALEWIYGLILPGAYAQEHITHFTRRSLGERLLAANYEILEHRYVGFCELISKARKAGSPVSSLPQLRQDQRQESMHRYGDDRSEHSVLLSKTEVPRSDQAL